MKIKRSIGVPAALLLYLIVMAVYSWPGRQPEVTYTQWIAVVAITFVCIVALHFVLEKRDKFRNKK